MAELNAESQLEEALEQVSQQPAEETEQPQVKEEVSDTTDINKSESSDVDKEEKNHTTKQNFDTLRKIKQKAEKERDEAYRRIKELETKSLESPPKPESPDEDLNINVDDDDFVDGRQMSKVDKKIRKLEEKLLAYEGKIILSQAETRLKVKYPDFGKIVNKETVDMLNEAYPEIAETLRSSQDLYNKGVAAYTMIKRLGLNIGASDDSPSVENNMRKPKVGAAVNSRSGSNPLSYANEYSKDISGDRKKELYKEMLRAAGKI